MKKRFTYINQVPFSGSVDLFAGVDGLLRVQCAGSDKKAKQKQTFVHYS
jgi:hypothetical protein